MAKNRKVSVDQLGDAFSVIFDEFEKELIEQFKEDLKEAGKVARKKVKEPPPGAGRYHDWTEYSKGWSMETKNDHFGEYKVVIRNKKSPGLTHLLEKGHITADGHSMSKKFPHIEPAAEAGAEEMLRRLKNGKNQS